MKVLESKPDPSLPTETFSFKCPFCEGDVRINQNLAENVIKDITEVYGNFKCANGHHFLLNYEQTLIQGKRVSWGKHKSWIWGDPDKVAIILLVEEKIDGGEWGILVEEEKKWLKTLNHLSESPGIIKIVAAANGAITRNKLLDFLVEADPDRSRQYYNSKLTGIFEEIDDRLLNIVRVWTNDVLYLPHLIDAALGEETQ